MPEANCSACAHCGKTFLPVLHQKYCCYQCSDAARRRRAGMQPAKQIAECKCGFCSKTFKPKSSRYVAYCSRECAFAAKAATPFSKVHTGYCCGCGKPYVSKNKRMYCSHACRPKTEYVSAAPEIRQCKCCGSDYRTEFTGGKLSDYCSEGCRELITSASKRVSKAKRRAVLKGATIERVDPLRVFERDRWHCQLCGIKTPKSKRGTYDDNAPELDHIVPLAKGGEHSYRNTQCACRKCNGAKSDAVIGQLLLIG